MSFRSPNTGPGRFLRNLQTGLVNGQDSIVLSFNPVRAHREVMIISNTDMRTLKLFKLMGVRTVGRIDGFSYPELYDNRSHGDSYRRTRFLTAQRLKISQEMQYVLMLCDIVVYQTAFSKAMCDRYLFQRHDRFSIIPNGVDTDLFKPLDKEHSMDLVFSMHGNCRDSDIMECTLRSVAQLSESIVTKGFATKIEFRFYGTMTPEVKSTYKKLSVSFRSGCLSFRDFGPSSLNQLAKALPESDLGFHLMSGDACPNAVLELLACGVPVVVQSFGGQAELVEDAGFVINVDGEFDYSETLINRLVDNVSANFQRIPELKLRARKRAEMHYSLQKMTTKYASVFGAESFD